MTFRGNISGAIARIVIAAALFSALLAISACGSADEPVATVAPASPDATEAPTPATASDVASDTTVPPAGSAKPAPSFELPNAKGETVSLSSYAGNTNVVLVFYRGFW